ncbi:hypothetical protein D9619_001834 [Psilocybe cf. subviscida]|uniref:Uncharacterized protein n=1 Tax=Psilocybe cf. subviscida TaxID=2480587 RepID=A0A8H5BEW5_9AGAR|nr:hypothetical protein D9619_001834 [Psilocybe cf. subviscida]
MVQWASIVDNRNCAENIDTTFPKSSKAYSVGSPLDPAPRAPPSTPHIPPHGLEGNLTHSGSPQHPSAYGSKVSAPPTPRHVRMAGEVHAHLHTPSRTLPHRPPHHSTRKTYSKAVVSRPGGTTDARGVIAAAGSGSGATATRLTGSGLGNVAPPKAIDVRLQLRGVRVARVRSQRTREHRSGEKKSDVNKDHAVSAAIAKNPTTLRPAPRLASNTPSRTSTPRPSPALNVREKDSTRLSPRPVWRG